MITRGIPDGRGLHLLTHAAGSDGTRTACLAFA